MPSRKDNDRVRSMRAESEQDRDPDVLAEQLTVRRWLEVNALPLPGDVTAAAVALAVALLAQYGISPVAMAGPGDLVEQLAGLTVADRRHLLVLFDRSGDLPRPEGPIQ